MPLDDPCKPSVGHSVKRSHDDYQRNIEGKLSEKATHIDPEQPLGQTKEQIVHDKPFYRKLWQRVKKPMMRVPYWDLVFYGNDAYSPDVNDMDSSDEEIIGATKKALEIGMLEEKKTQAKSNLGKKLLQQSAYVDDLFANVKSHRNINASTSCPVSNNHSEDLSSEKTQSSDGMKTGEKTMQSQYRENEQANIREFTHTAQIYHGKTIEKSSSDQETHTMKTTPTSNFVKHFASEKINFSNQSEPLSTILRVKSSEYPSRIQSELDDEIDRNVTVTPIGTSAEDDFNPLSI